jgi:hypothetical protein
MSLLAAESRRTLQMVQEREEETEAKMKVGEEEGRRGEGRRGETRRGETAARHKSCVTEHTTPFAEKF